MTLLNRLREIEDHMVKAIQSGRAPDSKYLRLLDRIAFGHIRPTAVEKAAVMEVMERIRRRTGWGSLKHGDEKQLF